MYITDELLNKYYELYKIHVLITTYQNINPIPFYKFVDIELKFNYQKLFM